MQSPYAKDLPKDSNLLFELKKYPLLDVKAGINASASMTQKQFIKLLKMITEGNVVKNDVEKMQEAYKAKDWERVQELAHKIKSGAIYIGTVRMKMACQYLERYWKTGQRIDLEKLYQQALTVIDDTHTEIRNFLDQKR